jgi:hypothetical protein
VARNVTLEILMFDVYQITWWLIESSLVGYCCTYFIFEDNTDRYIFAPIAGFSCIHILGNLFWMWSVTTRLTSFLFVAVLTLAVTFCLRHRPKPNLAVAATLVSGFLLVTLHGSLIPFDEKLFQAYPLDRFYYLGGTVLFAKENFSYFADALKRIAFNGDKRAFFSHPLLPMALVDMEARPATETAFLIFSWATPRDLHRLGNAWEVFIRAIQFIGVYTIFWKGLRRPLLSCFFAVSIVLGYWFQFTKDTNAWSSSASLAIALASVALVLSMLNDGEVRPRKRYFLYMLCLANTITYPELGIPFCLGLFIVVCANALLRNTILLRRAVFFELLIFVAAVFTIYPSIIWFLQRQYQLAPFMIGGEEFTGRGIYRIFESIGQRQVFVTTIIEKPIRLFTDVWSLSDLTIGISGFSYLAYLGSFTVFLVSLFILAAIVAAIVGNARPHLNPRILVLLAVLGGLLLAVQKLIPGSDVNFDRAASLIFAGILLGTGIYAAIRTTKPNLRILLVLVGFYSLFFAVFLVTGKIGGAYRVLPFWGAFGSIGLLIFLSASQSRLLRSLAVVVACAHLIFGTSIFYVTNKGGMETYPSYYSHATGVRHHELPTIRDKYDFDYLPLIPQLRLCHTVFLNLPQSGSVDQRAPRFFVVNLALFLENNDINYYLAMPYRNASLLGDAFFPGFKKEEVNADCVIEEEVRGSRIAYKFVQAKWY